MGRQRACIRTLSLTAQFSYKLKISGSGAMAQLLRVLVLHKFLWHTHTHTHTHTSKNCSKIKIYLLKNKPHFCQSVNVNGAKTEKKQVLLWSSRRSFSCCWVQKCVHWSLLWILINRSPGSFIICTPSNGTNCNFLTPLAILLDFLDAILRAHLERISKLYNEFCFL